jgi:photosystem II stability/assembly factor-like uncharacterized protein
MTDNQLFSIIVNNSNLYAGAGSKVYFSSDIGASWTSISNGLPLLPVYSLAFIGNTLFAGLWSGGGYSSVNNGQSWEAANNGLSSNVVITLAVNGTNLYAGTTAGLFKSTDLGHSWNTANSGLGVTYILYIYSYNSYLFAGTWNGGIYSSSNGGANWINVSTGLTNLDDRALTVFNSNLFAATVGGVWRRPLSEIVSVQEIGSTIPDKYELEQNYPNPFNPVTNIKYQITKNGFVTLAVYDALGRVIETLVNEKQTAGIYETTFDASKYSSGVYFYRIQTDGFSDVKKMLLVK